MQWYQINTGAEPPSPGRIKPVAQVTGSFFWESADKLLRWHYPAYAHAPAIPLNLASLSDHDLPGYLAAFPLQAGNGESALFPH